LVAVGLALEIADGGDKAFDVVLFYSEVVVLVVCLHNVLELGFVLVVHVNIEAFGKAEDFFLLFLDYFLLFFLPLVLLQFLFVLDLLLFEFEFVNLFLHLVFVIFGPDV